MAGPERIELPPPGSKPGMISISPKADVKEPCCDLTKSTGQGRVVWRKITESNCHRCQWTGFQVQLASKASIFQNCGAGRENRTLTLSLARTQATITSYPQKLGGECGSRTHSTAHHHRRISNPMPSHPAHSPMLLLYSEIQNKSIKIRHCIKFKGSQVQHPEPSSHIFR